MTFDPVFELSSLDGSNGFVINGIAASAQSGRSVSGAGDINGDGIDDLIVGAPFAAPNGNFLAGTSYVVFGSDQGFSASLELSALDGTNGFVLNGIDASDRSGDSVSGAGDINGDGIDDLIVGATNADPNGNNSGESYVVFGSDQGFSASLELSALDGTNGFIFEGATGDDRVGASVSGAGDINGDGIDDILIGAPRANPNGVSRAGESYVVFGSDQGFSTSLSPVDLDGTNGFVINGIDEPDASGITVSGVGDINGDGIDDLIVGAINADPNGNSNAGESYVVFGSDQGFSASLELSALNGTNGFVLNGIDAGDSSGYSLSGAGDINGDGIDDLIIGARGPFPGDGRTGESYVVFGSDQGFSASLELSALDGTNGFIFEGATGDDRVGASVSGAGDINGDGIDDLIIGAYDADPNGFSRAGESYVVFGSDQGFSASLSPVDLDGTNGFVINGIDAIDNSGNSVSGAVDINGDGIDDLIIGARFAGPNGNSFAGESYVVFGRATESSVPLVFGEPATLFVDDEGILQGNGFGAGNPYTGDLFSNTDGTANPDDAILGTDGDDTIWPGETGNDLIDAGEGNNTIGIGTGDSQVAAGAGDDFLYSIAGGGGTNVIDLGDGSNRIWVENGDYDITTGSGNDEIGLGTGTDVVNAGDGNNLIYLVDTVDPATVGDKDILTGLGDDFIQTGGGNDRIDAGLGFNTLNGGTGADIFTARTGAYNFIGDFELGIDQVELADFAFAELSFFQGTGDVAADVFGFVDGEAVLQVANTTVAALDNTANFV
ncbi:MAG: hypothetical protein AAGD09_15020 [Cyanobacteria bacterium P01_F01_bin.56]